MNLTIRFVMMLLPVSILACAAGDPAPTTAEGVEATPPGSSPAPVATAEPASSGTSSAGAPAAAGSCPYFCAPKNGACTRPAVATADLGKLTCGNYSMGKLSHMNLEACPAECCPARKEGTGDKDADGIFDINDKCPDAPEDVDGNTDWDGCADPDNDGDGLEDVDDKCCYVAEDKDGTEDLDGCPEP
jgi:large repetitive protein